MRKLLMFLVLLFMVTTPAHAEGRFVRGVIDGQTLRLLNGEEVHLLGIEVPQELSEQAADFVRSLVSGSVVALEYDVQRADDEGNILAYVWFRYEPRMREEQVIFPPELDVHYVVDSEGDGDFFVLLNTTVVKAGLAMPLKALPNNKYANLIDKLYEENQPIETVQAETEVHAKAVID